MQLRLHGQKAHEKSAPKRHGRQPRTLPVPRLPADSRPGYAGQPECASDTAVGSSGTGGHPPPGPRARRFPVLLWNGLQQECDGGVRRTGNDRGGFDYSPYGAVTGTGSLVQPVQWSGEMHDEEPALAYYNYRFYNPADGRWINRDPIAEQAGWNLYAFVGNSLNIEIDLLGTAWSSLQTEAGAALAARQAAEAAAKAAARAAGTAIAAERSKRNKRCAELYREKSEAKKEARGSSCRDMIIPECPTQSECNAFNDRYEKMKRFAEARKAYDDECHQGGDKGHQEQSKGWNEGAQNCKNKYDECIANTK